MDRRASTGEGCSSPVESNRNKLRLEGRSHLHVFSAGNLNRRQLSDKISSFLKYTEGDAILS